MKGKLGKHQLIAYTNFMLRSTTDLINILECEN